LANERLITADTKGRFKLWDISKVDFRAETSPEAIRSKIRLVWYI